MPSRNRSRQQNRQRNMRGGSSFPNMGSWVEANFGNAQTQWNNVFGPGSNATSGNLLQTIPGAPAVVPGTFPPQTNRTGTLSVLTGGRRRSKKVRFGKGYNKKYRGGGMITQMAVPATLLAMQQLAYRRKGMGMGSMMGSRRRSSRRRGSRSTRRR